MNLIYIFPDIQQTKIANKSIIWFDVLVDHLTSSSEFQKKKINFRRVNRIIVLSIEVVVMVNTSNY